jgi:agmatine deiminase
METARVLLVPPGPVAATTYTITLLPMEQDDSWLRDTGPTFVTKNRKRSEQRSVRSRSAGGSDVSRCGSGEGGPSAVVGVCWKFDAWGQICYPDWSRDILVGRQLCAHYALSAICPLMVLEGGSIHVDGEGTLLTVRAHLYYHL